VQQRLFTVGVASGDGLVARFGEVVMYVGSTEPATAELLAAADSAARVPHPGDRLPERLAAVASGVAWAVPFGVVAPGSDGFLVLLRRAVTAEFQTLAGGQSEQRLSGDDATTFVGKTIPDDLVRVGIFSATHRVRRATAHTDLRAGVVPGGGFVLLRAQPKSNIVATEHIPAKHVVAMSATATRSPAETALQAAAPAVLAAKDGAVYALDRAYVIGRSPYTDESVRNATASPIVLPNDPHVSRVHAYITVERGAVFVRDASTHAGTFIAAPGSETWTRIGETPTRLERGWSLRIGEWIVTHRA
jgi:hypothetical protein